jgi:hypothetical protein
MPKADDLIEHRPAARFNDDDEKAIYNLIDGKIRYRNLPPIRGADPDTFRFYLGGFGKDAKACYLQNRTISGAIPQAFRALNYCYASDGERVWCIGGELKGCDAATFEALDNGDLDLGPIHGVRRRAPYGYGKDAKQVWYYDFDGKPNVVKKADAATFHVVTEHFAIDAKAVYFGASTIPKADPKTWTHLGLKYSKDSKRIYFTKRVVEGADLNTFEVAMNPVWPLARDAARFYNADEVIAQEQFETELRKYSRIG